MATSPNVFDQFDTKSGGNVFDQFDDASAKQGPSRLDTILRALELGPAGGDLGKAEAALSLGSGMMAAPLAGLSGIAQAIKNQFSPGMPAGDRVQQVASGLTYQPRTQVGQQITEGLNYPFAKLAQFGDYAGRNVAQASGSPAVGAALNTGVQALPALLLRGRGGPAEVASDVTRSPAVGSASGTGAGAAAPELAAPPGRVSRLAPVSEESPSKGALKSAAKGLYKQAEDAGVVVSESAFDASKATLVNNLKGLNPTLHPRATAALQSLLDKKGPITLDDLETQRRIARDAENTPDAADQRMAGEIVDHIDEFAENLKPEDYTAGDATGAQAVKALQQARTFWSRARKADTLDELVRRADIRAQQFSGSGYENALRTEFRSLAMNERRMKLFTAEERAAITKVAKGGSLENVLRMLGKFAPTNLVSTIGGVMAGSYAGGPVGGIALPMAGGLSRLAATRMTMNNAAAANALVRRGPFAPPEPLQVAAPAQGVLTP